MSRIPMFIALALSLTLFACAEEDNGNTNTASGFSKVYTEVIEPGCSCHFNAGHVSGLFLGDEQSAYDNLVGVAGAGPSCTGSGDRVVAGDPASSILYNKVIDDGTNRCGDRMPLGGALSADQQEVIRAWIAEGAPRN